MPYKDPIKRRETGRIRTLRYYYRHREQLLTKQREQNAKNPKIRAVIRQRHYKKNRKEIIAKASAYWRAHKSEIQAKYRSKQQEYYRRNAEKIKAAVAKRKREHPAKTAHYNNRRRARKYSANGFHTVEQWLNRVALYGWRCSYCWTPLTIKTLTKDHRIPLSRGGSEWPSNLVPACRSCNAKKGVHIS